MKIQHKITLVSSALFGSVLLLASVVIYISFDRSSKNIFYSELARTAKIAGMFYLEKDELSKSQYQPIEEAFYNLSSEQRISIYDDKGDIAFNTDNQNRKIGVRLQQIRHEGTLNFKSGNTYYHGLFYKDNQGDFVVLVHAKNPLIQNQLRTLILILLVSFLVGMLFLTVLTSRLSKFVYKPVRHTIRQVEALDLHQEKLSLSYKSTDDELEELFRAFNGLLREIEQTYQQQKNFVDYASHELKTPLTVMINQLEVVLQRPRSNEEYRDTASIALQEAEHLRDLMKNLLTFSSLHRVVHQKEDLRIDELLWQVIDQLEKSVSKNRFRFNLNVFSDHFSVLEFRGNKTLLQMAVFNILENAAKFSGEKPVNIKLSVDKNHLLMEISDCGIGMTANDIDHISQPFYRASNATTYPGTGLGLSIALKVFELHEITYTINSRVDTGTVFTFVFPNTNQPKKESS